MQKYVTEQDEPGTSGFMPMSHSRRAKESQDKKHACGKEGEEHTKVCDRTGRAGDIRFYAHEPKPERHRITEEKFGAQYEPQRSLLNASDCAGQTGGHRFIPVSRSRN